MWHCRGVSEALGGEVGDYHDDDEVAHISCNMCNNYALADSTLSLWREERQS